MIKSKFSAVLKVLSQKMKVCESEMMKLQTQIRARQEQIQECLEQMAQIPLPQSGSPLLIAQSYEGKRAILSEIDELQSQIAELKLQKKQQTEHFKQLQFEFEKMKYLHSKETRHKLEVLKRKERHQEDEIALILNFQGECDEKNPNLF